MMSKKPCKGVILKVYFDPHEYILCKVAITNGGI